ncbi:acyl-CoA desaturase [Lentzea sp. NBRC 102530]|uniref:fatty acid desaturase family protein n=1 Tax=Lentzea sp. NBRC 102530 TaxID=3032201 RepID=UPI0024A06CE9|nr:acyl-CoA desaturase [Lentzea sp. NBRC 102530]GLY48953.1 fatty acid desaturase [Lentzea sp. NBRC 102530]
MVLRPASDFAQLSALIKQAGLLERRRGHYYVRIGVNLAVYAAAWVAFALLGDSWWQLLVAAVLAAMTTQLAFIGHDAGHKQIFASRRWNEVVGYVHSGIVGVSYDWWVGKHSRHHANPNHEDEDPDVDISVLAFTQRQGEAKSGALRWIASKQAVLFFPLLLLEGFALHWHSIRHSGRERAVMIANVVVYLAVVFWVLSPVYAVAFVLVHQALWGFYMGCSFAPNHKGMPVLSAGHTLDFLRKQVLTSRNIRGGWFTDVLLGGLNYQIEHHLFPSMPRPALRHAQSIVQNFCAQRGISYAQCGLFRSYGYVLQHLHEIGATLSESGQRSLKTPA